MTESSHTCAVLIFIRIIQAIIISITDPSLWYASLVITCEIPWIGTGLDRRFGIWISLARAVVTGKTFTIRTSTPDFQTKVSTEVRWDGETKLLAVAIVIVTRMLTCKFKRLLFIFGTKCIQWLFNNTKDVYASYSLSIFWFSWLNTLIPYNRLPSSTLATICSPAPLSLSILRMASSRQSVTYKNSERKKSS